MKLGRKHMVASLVMLVGSIVWNFWVFTKPAAVSTPKAVGSAPPMASLATDSAPVDPASIPSPPKVDLNQPPVWPRNPFAQPAELAPPPLVEEPAVGPPPAEPVVGAILYSSGRRLALVNGRVVAVGDRVGDATVSEIATDAVIIEKAGGEQQRLPIRRIPLITGGKR